MNKLQPTSLLHYDLAIAGMMAEKYGMSRMQALRAFITSETHAMLEDAENGLYAFCAPGIFDMWESEAVTGDPRNSIYIRGE